MRAIRLTADHQLSTTDVPRPEIGPSDALIKIEAAGVCGSDVGAYLGKSSYDFLEYPRTLGHEYVGIVRDVGRNVDGFEAGDRVVERPIRSCGDCPTCRRGQENVCSNLQLTGFHENGAFTTHAAAPESHLHPVPDEMPVARAAMIEPTSVAYRGVVTVGAVEPGERVLVLGPGPIGCLSALIARRAGCEVAVAGLPRDRHRLATLGEFGVETAVVRPEEEPSHSREFDATIDATGSASGVESAIAASQNGGRAVVLGIPPKMVRFDGAALVRGEKAIRSSYAALSVDFERVIALQTGSRSVQVEELADEFGMADPTRAFDAFNDGSVIKPIFRPNDT